MAVPAVAVIAPLVLLTAELTARAPAAFRPIVPVPLAVTELVRVMLPALVTRLMLPFPAVLKLALVVIAPPAVMLISPLLVVVMAVVPTPTGARFTPSVSAMNTPPVPVAAFSVVAAVSISPAAVLPLCRSRQTVQPLWLQYSRYRHPRRQLRQ